MYQLARILSIVSVLLGAYCLIQLARQVTPYVAVLIVLFVLGTVIRQRRRRPLTTLGSAKFADESELSQAGMMGGPSGAIIGRLPKHLAGRRVPSLRKLFDKKISAKEACQAFFRNIHPKCDELVRLNNVVHTLVCSRSGGGKNVSYVGPLLLTCGEGSAAVIDPKGESYLLSAKHRRKAFGHKIFAVDPFQLVSDSAATLNPLDFIEANDPHCIDRCRDLATALIEWNPESREPHWDQSAEILLTALILLVVQYGDAGTRSLQTVRELSSPDALDGSIKAMRESECCGGMLRHMGEQLLYYIDKERNSVCTTLNRHLRFLDSPAIAASTRTSSFNPADLRNGKITVYFILPAEHKSPGLMRMWLSTTIRLIQAGGLQERNKIQIVCDEAASLKKLDVIDEALSIGRGYGIRLHLIYQSLAQRRECFPNGQDGNVLANCALCCFGISENSTAQYISERLGDSTIIVESGGTNSGSSYQSSQSTQSSTSKGSSYGSNSNWAQQTRRLLKPEEVMTLPDRVALTFVPGMNPIMTSLVRTYEENLARRQWLSRAGAAVATLAMSIVLLGFALIGAATLSGGLDGSQPSYSGRTHTSPYRY